jgi:hypothetical protein
LPGVVKIGRSTQIPEQRMAELNGTHLPFPFEVSYRALVRNCFITEKLTHDALKAVRVTPNREFFRRSTAEVAQTIKVVAGDSMYYERYRDEVDIPNHDDELKVDIDPFVAWVQRCQTSEAIFSATRELYTSWCGVCRDTGQEPESEKALVRRLVRYGFRRKRAEMNGVRGRRGFVGLAVPQPVKS